jgi:hypothetical protein
MSIAREADVGYQIPGSPTGLPGPGVSNVDGWCAFFGLRVRSVYGFCLKMSGVNAVRVFDAHNVRRT